MDPSTPPFTSKFPLRSDYPDVFPPEFLTPTTSQDFQSFNKNFFSKHNFDQLSLEEYMTDFHKNPGKYDLHDINFQNFALTITSKMDCPALRALSLSKDHANKRLLRSTVYAISGRSDIGWNGEALSEDQTAKKQDELDQYWKSCILFDWERQNFNQNINVMNNQECVVVVSENDTQTAVENLSKKFPDKKIAWLNLANAHNTLGSYNVNYGGSQEEEVATNTTAAFTLGLHANTITDGIREYVIGENHIVYRDGHHIPPGGNYFSKTKFITCSPQIDCFMIAAAFADFRPYLPIAKPWSESSYYFNFLTGKVSDQKKLEQRLSADIIGVIQTAIYNEIDVLVLGASGCGAFLHDPWLESKLWKEHLIKYKGYFACIEFAILPDKERPDNTIAFKKNLEEVK